MDSLDKEKIEACEQLKTLYQQLMIESQTNIRKHQRKQEVEESNYKTYKAHFEEYTKLLKQLKGEVK